MGIIIVERGKLGVDLRLDQIGLRRVARGERLIILLTAGGLGMHQGSLPVVVGLSLFEACLSASFRRLRLLELYVIGLRLDREEQCPLLHGCAVLVVHLLDEAGHARHEIG